MSTKTLQKSVDSGLIVFISGPCTGHPQNNYPAFIECERRIMECGNNVSVLNPAHILRGTATMHYEGYMEICFAMIRQADVVIQMDGWTKSNGAMREHHYARAMKKLLMSETDFINAETEKRNQP